MPAFYPRNNMPRHLPLTPPEFVPSYHHSGCGGMPYQQSSYSGQPSIRQHDDGYDFADRYGQLSIAMPPMYPQAGTYLSNAPPSLPPPNSFYDAPILPPMRVQNEQQQQQRVQDFNQRATQQPKEEKPVGGVSAKLDYDMDVMTDFVCEKALQVITPGRMMPPSFRKWVHQVLCATRLPSATILLSMFYLSTRMPMVASVPKNDSHLFRMLTIALVLGSKFLDDNTFINRSWSEVSGISVTDLNMMELEWLKDIEFKLHRDPSEQQGWVSWSDHWKEYQGHANARTNRANKLNPIDTSMHRRSLNKPLPPLPVQQQQQQSYNPPPYEFTPKSAHPSYNSSNNSNNNSATYAQYDPWRSANDHSPASAPNTGPTTPEYYGASGAWAPEGYSRRTMFGFPPLSQSASGQSQQQQQQQQLLQQQQQQSHYGTPAYSTQYQAPVWNSHGINCGCMYCAHRHPSFFMSAGFAPQAVAV